MSDSALKKAGNKKAPAGPAPSGAARASRPSAAASSSTQSAVGGAGANDCQITAVRPATTRFGPDEVDLKVEQDMLDPPVVYTHHTTHEHSPAIQPPAKRRNQPNAPGTSQQWG